MKSRLYFLAPAVCSLLLGLLWISGGSGFRPAPLFGEENTRYLEESFQRALTGFGVLSGLKAGLAVVEGSTGGVSAGVSVQLQVGDIVQAAYDYVDLAWRALFFGCISLMSLQWILQIADSLGIFLAGLFFMGLGIRLLLCCLPGRVAVGRKICSDGLLACLGLLFLTLVILPLSVQLSSGLSRHLTEPALLEASEGFQRTSSDLFPEAESGTETLWAQVRAVPERLEQIAVVLRERSRQLGLWTVQLVAGYLFDCFLFPLGSFLVLGVLSRSSWRYVCTETRFQHLLEEIRMSGAPNPNADV